MQILFITISFIILYTFLGYPLLLLVLSKCIPKKVLKKERDDFFVSIIIAAYNEENCIRLKLENTLQLDYPKEKMEIIVASDGSTDSTDNIVREFSEKGIILYRVEGRKGKTEAQNQAVKIAKGDIIIFSDANAFYDSDAVRKIVRNFNDQEIGGVCGQLIYLNRTNSEMDTENHYWSFENSLKENESTITSILGANGSIYATKKNRYVFLPANLMSDLVEPLKIVEKGYRVVFEKEAISREDISSASGQNAFNRKVRINNRAIIGLINSLKLLNAGKYGMISLQFFSHKILRYIIPFLLIFLMILNTLILDSYTWIMIFIIQCIFYIFAIIGYLFSKKSKRIYLFSFPWYFVWTHLAILFAWFQFIQGKQTVIWEVKR